MTKNKEATKEQMISDVFIRRPVTSIVISLVLVICGVLAILNLPVSQYPNITPPVVNIVGNYTGADARPWSRP
jgi:HAE1 family hydrophobic/amphiphilic exporter-1